MILDRLGKELLFFDGGMGTLLQAGGLKPGELPETWNISHPEQIMEIHRNYIEAGSDIIPVSYTHLDVYKRQYLYNTERFQHGRSQDCR